MSSICGGLVRMFLGVIGEQRLPFGARVRAALAHMRGEVLAHAVRHHEELVGIEAEKLLGAAHLLGAERLAMGRRRVVLAG